MQTQTETDVSDRIGYSASALGRRGWTQKMIRELLGAPDDTQTNPYYSQGSRMQVFRFDRVEAVEATEAFATAILAKHARSRPQHHEDIPGLTGPLKNRRDAAGARAAMEDQRDG